MTAWYADREVRRMIATRYVPWLLALSLVWELAQLPLYTLWTEASPAYVTFAVVHCAAGDVLIGSAALAVALLATRAGAMQSWSWRAIGLVLASVGVAYTAFSEWINTVLRPAWAYSELMPTLRLGGVALGLSPLLQWLVVPPLALHLARIARAA